MSSSNNSAEHPSMSAAYAAAIEAAKAAPAAGKEAPIGPKSTSDVPDPPSNAGQSFGDWFSFKNIYIGFTTHSKRGSVAPGFGLSATPRR
ncbi:MAG: hypothetical protein MMC23_005946 [Stictis urceolatum]|nr:hypothetical protein [Stictis urceolata]